MSDPVLLPGGRDVRATLDEAGIGVGSTGDDTATTDDEAARADAAVPTAPADACVVACPPHPQHRGHRGDGRLVAVSDHLTARGVDCLRFDYGDWDEGYGELADVHNALEWATERYDRVGLFGFSFGGCLALLAAGGATPTGGVADPPALAAVSALAPAAALAADLDAVAVMDRVVAPAQVVYGSRDDAADWEPVVARARELDWTVTELQGDHFFVGQSRKVADAVGGFLLSALVE